MSKKALIFCFFGFFCLAVLGLFATIWYVDPFRLFHKPFMCENQVYSDMRYNARGYIDYMDFDSIILGNSTLANTRASLASELLNAKFINISMLASEFKERAIILEYAFKKKKLKKVILGFDRGYLVPEFDEKEIATDKFDFLYDEKPLDDIKIYFNDDFMNKILSFSCKKEPEDIYTPSNWLKGESRFISGIQGWINGRAQEQIKEELEAQIQKINQKNAEQISKEDYEAKKEYIEKNILSFARKHPDTEFLLVAPPYHAAKSSLYAKDPNGVFAYQKSLIKYILDQKLKNVKIYIFDDLDFTFDANNYFDLIHSIREINDEILKLISQKKQEITNENIDLRWGQIEQRHKDFDLNKFYSDFAAGIKAKNAKKE